MGSLPAAEAKKPINLLWGKPSPSLIPTDQMGAAAQKVFSNPTIAIAGMQYGDSPHAGYVPLRQRLSAYLSGFYGCPSDPNHLCITGGASQGLTVILQTLSDPIATKAVWMTSPCFFAARKVFEDGGLTGKLRGVNELDDGSIDLEYLEREMAKLENQPKTNIVRVIEFPILSRTLRDHVGAMLHTDFLMKLIRRASPRQLPKNPTPTSSISSQPSPIPRVNQCHSPAGKRW